MISLRRPTAFVPRHWFNPGASHGQFDELTPAKRANLAELTRGFRGIVLLPVL